MNTNKENAALCGTNNISTSLEVDSIEELALKPSCNRICGVEGEILRSDLRIPTLGIAQGVGPLAEQFRAGNIVLGGQTLLSNGPEPVELCVVAMRKFYQEKLPYGSEQRPMLFEKQSDVIAAGGTLDWGADGTPPTYEAVIEAHLLIRRPDGVEGAFPYTFNGADYAAARWFIRGMAYKGAGRTLLTTASQFATGQNPLYSARFELTTTKQRVRNGNNVAVPQLRVAGKNDEAFCAWVAGLQC